MHKPENAPRGTLDKWTRRINWLLAAISGVIGLAIIAVMIHGVIMRYIFRDPTVYALELPRMLFIVLIALCLSYAQMGHRHIRIEFLTSKLRGMTKAIFYVLALLATLAYCVMVVWSLWGRSLQYLRQGRTTMEAAIPLAPFSIVIVIGVSLLALQVIFELAMILSGKATSEPEAGPAGHKEPTL